MLALSLTTPIQSNDSVILRLRDNSGTYNAGTNPTGWGSPNYSLSDIISSLSTESSKYHLLMEVTITTSSGVETVYDTVDLYSLSGPFVTVEDLVFDITPSVLSTSGVVLNSETLPDGWYNITYKISEAFGTFNVLDSISLELLVDGNVRTAVYSALRTVPYSTTFERYTHNVDEWDDVINPIYTYSLLQGMLAEVTVAKKEEILNMLSTLENNLSN